MSRTSLPSRALAALSVLLLAACASVAPPPVTPPAAPASGPAPAAAPPPTVAPSPAVVYAPPVIDRSYTSENQDSRTLFLILHYTVIDWEKSLKVLTTGGQVSAHYLVRDNPARIYQLVDENRRAWHAGPSFWGGNANLNSSSIGIEIVNPGYTDSKTGRTYAPFPQAQIDQVIALVRDIQARHQIRPERIIGHADIAPGRKQDPGPNFPWKQLADAGLIPWPDANQVIVKRLQHEVTPVGPAFVQERLARIGYNVSRSGELDAMTKDVVATFQMKYRPSDYSGQLDAETTALIEVVSNPGGLRMATPSVATTAATKPYTSRW
jgi:N-acetylmuramoyl-L-alanine amidase